MAFADTLQALNSMKAEGVIDDYALAGAMALVFWTEPVPTWDLDVLVFLPAAASPLVSLDGIYRWASDHGYPIHTEHVIIEGVPTQFVASPGRLGDEAIETAATLEYEGVTTRVALPEYLVPSTCSLRRELRSGASGLPCSWSGQVWTDRVWMRSLSGMGSRFEDGSRVSGHARPSADLVARLRRGKADLRREREQMPLREKVLQVIELQRLVYPILSRRRALEPWERPWEIEP